MHIIAAEVKALPAKVEQLTAVLESMLDGAVINGVVRIRTMYRPPIERLQ